MRASGGLTLNHSHNMYCTPNFKTKKHLKEALKEHNALLEMTLRVGVNEANKRSMEYFGRVPKPVTVFQPNSDLTGAVPPSTGKVYLEGPHYPEPHRWYAEAWLTDGYVTRIK